MKSANILAVVFLIAIFSIAHAEVLVDNKDLRIRNGGLILDSSVIKSALVPSSTGLALGSSSAGWDVYATDVHCSACIDLATETSGDYVGRVTAGTGINVSSTGSHGGTYAISLKYPSIACSSGQAIQSFNLGDGTKVCAAFLTSCSACDGYFVKRSGDTMTGILNAQHIYPAADNTYDLGSSTKRWRNIWIYGAIYGGNTTYYLNPAATDTSANFAGNINLQTGKKLCLNGGSCSAYIYYDGSKLVIKVG